MNRYVRALMLFVAVAVAAAGSVVASPSSATLPAPHGHLAVAASILLLAGAGWWGVARPFPAFLTALVLTVGEGAIRKWVVNDIVVFMAKDFLVLGIYVGLESVAASLRSYEAQLVHGLLQTRDYARAVFRACDRKATAEHIDRQAELRMKRQEALTRPDAPLELWAVLDEAVLRRPVGGPQVMRAQLGKLLEAAELPNLTVQVLPFAQGAHAGLNGPFCIMDFPGGDPATVYVGSAAGNTFLEKAHQVQRWAEAFDQLRAAALSPGDTRETIATLSAET